MHGLLVSHPEHELDVVQRIVEVAKDGFPSRISLSAFTVTLTEALSRSHSFELSYYLIYHAGQTVQATWVAHDRVRADPIHAAFCKAMQTKMLAYMKYATAFCASVREMPRSIAKLSDLVGTLCTVNKSAEGRDITPHICSGTMEATQLATFVQKVNEEAALICTKHQLEEAHQLRFVAEAVKMLYINLKNARNSGEPFNTMSKIINGKLGDIITVLPLPVAIYALSHVSGTAAMASTMNK